MRFVYPEVLWLLLLLLPLAILYTTRGVAPALRFSTVSIAQNLGKPRKARRGRFILCLRLLSLAVLVIAIARPQYGSSVVEVEASGIDIFLAVDISGSMEAMDFSLNDRPANRLFVVKEVVRDFIDDRPNDRIGLLAFSGLPYLVCPLTLDHDWLRKRLDALEIGTIKEDGTAIGSAIASGVNRLRGQQAKSKIIILLTDGINNTGKIPPLTAAEAAETLKIKVYTIGAGTRGEAPMPITDSFGRKRLVRVRVDIDEHTLRQVADMTGAAYFRATDTASLEKVYREINTMEKTTRKMSHFGQYRELFPYLLLLFLFLFIIELLQTRRRIP